MNKFILLLIIIIIIIINKTKITTKKNTNLINFASSESGANIKESNPEFLSPKSILSEDKEKYMLIKREVNNKYLIIQLSEEIIMESFTLINYEYYSCYFKNIQLFGSVKYPCYDNNNNNNNNNNINNNNNNNNKKNDNFEQNNNKKCWEEIGNFTSKNIKGSQTFLLLKKPFTIRYLKIIFLSGYGNEYYCTLSKIR
jgi:hypothetical protein